MLSVHFVLLEAITISALSVQLGQPVVEAGADSAVDLVSPNGPQAAVNASFPSNLSSDSTRQWNGTIELPPNESNQSFPYHSTNGSSQVSTNPYLSTSNTSAMSWPFEPAPNPTPLPYDWHVKCSDRLGTGINALSCFDAWNLFPRSALHATFGPRRAGEKYDIGLPRRYQSCKSRQLVVVILPTHHGLHNFF